MISVPGYRILGNIYESSRSLVFRARRTTDSLPVILKLLKGEYPSPEEIILYKREYRVTSHLSAVPGVIGVHGLEKYQNTFLMVLEDFGADSLNIVMSSQSLEIAELLSIFIRLTEILGRIHAQNVIHKDINPSNVVYNRATSELKVIDFGFSTVLSREAPLIKNPEVLEGTLAYVSPEQTGRMNRAVDYRTDYYSLGVTFYELLTGRVPFETTDALEMLHCHMARVPLPPHLLCPQVPQALSEIVCKLLSKNAEDRYQSSVGLRADLAECSHRLESTGRADSFPLAARDVPERFEIPQKLYGRQDQIASLLASFERISNGGREATFLMGPAGIGKTALVREIVKPVTQRHGYFTSGKYERLQRTTPHSALLAAFRGLVRQILTESDERIGSWRNKLHEALGANTQLISDVIPELEIILGAQPSPREVEPEESRNRFSLAFIRFVSVFCSREHSLVLFLDDLQWADSASLKVLQSIISGGDGDTAFLLVLGAYRDNEVGPTDPLRLTLTQFQESGERVRSIRVGPLAQAHVMELCADALHCDEKSVGPLAELLLQKTGGNPFHLNEFLKSLYLQNLLEFTTDEGGWRWDLVKIESLGITDSVLELMAAKINRLDEYTRRTLTLAACLGNRFEIQPLALSLERTQRQVMENLVQAMTEGLILPTGEGWKYIELDVSPTSGKVTFEFKFCHDRVQQAAYSLIPLADRPGVHLRMGRILRDSAEGLWLDRTIFTVVNQLNVAVDLMTDESERRELAELNLRAGKRAKAAGAYEAACTYLNTGIRLLGQDCWTDCREPAWELHLEAARAAYLCSDFDKMEQQCGIALANANSRLERARIYEVKIQAAIAQYKMPEAVRIGLSVLRLLGVSLPEQPKKSDLILGFVKTRLMLAGKTMDELSRLREMTDPTSLAAVRIMSIFSKAAYAVRPELAALLALESVRLSLKYGNAPESAVAYAYYGVILCNHLGDIEKGYRFGQLAERLAEGVPGASRKSRVALVVNFMVRHWKEHHRDSLRPLLDGYQSGLETGNLDDASYCAYAYCTGMFRVGLELGIVEREMSSLCDTLRKLKHESVLRVLEIYRQTVLNLINGSDDACSLTGVESQEEEMFRAHKMADYRGAICCMHLNKLMLCYLFEDPDEALRNADLASQYLDGVAGTPAVSVFYFYDSLVRLALYQEASQAARRAILRKVDANQKKLKKWARHGPMNHLHRYLLVDAERSRVLNQQAMAEESYDRAIALANKHDYINEAALANELAARFYAGKEKMTIAKSYMIEAKYGYTRWGAKAKVAHIEEAYRRMVLEAAGTSAATTEATSSLPTITTSGGQDLDLAWVMKASQAISKEIILPRLLDKLLRISIENAGAQRGLLLLEDKGNLVVSVEVWADSATAPVIQSVPLEQYPEISRSIVNYVARAKANIVINDASRGGEFSRDPYIKEIQPKSILCGPIIHQGKLTGILYLENRLAADVFTENRLELLRLLCSQAAISIENARFHEQLANYSRTLEQRVAERTGELSKANEQLSEEIVVRRNVEQQLKSSLQEKEVLLREIHHRVKNNLATVSSLLRLQARYVKDQTMREMFESAENRVHSLQVLHEKLYKSENLADLRARDYLCGLIKHLHEFHSGIGSPVQLNLDIEDVCLGVDTAIPLGFIITELFSNCAKHAFPGGRRGEVTISLSSHGNEEYELTVADNGIGLPEDAQLGQVTSLGLRMVNIFVRQLRGLLDVTRNGGTSFRIKFSAGEK